jgi:hypothetical protein
MIGICSQVQERLQGQISSAGNLSLRLFLRLFLQMWQ